MPCGNLEIGPDCRLLQRLQATADIVIDRPARTRRPFTADIFAAENAAGKRRIGEQPDILVVGQFRQIEIEVTIKQVVFVLRRGDARQACLFGDGKILLVYSYEWTSVKVVLHYCGC